MKTLNNEKLFDIPSQHVNILSDYTDGEISPKKILIGVIRHRFIILEIDENNFDPKKFTHISVSVGTSRSEGRRGN